jgi:hypothetical protein
MTQLQHMAAEIRNLRSQIQGYETEAYQIFMGMQNDYCKIKSNLNNAIAMAQQHATETTEVHFNLTVAQFAEVVATHMALRRYVETIAISNAANEEQQSTLLHDFTKQWEANQNVWIAYHREQVAKQEKFNHDCQQWANEMNQREAKAKADHERVKKDQAKAKEEQEKVKQDLQEIKRLQE